MKNANCNAAILSAQSRGVSPRNTAGWRGSVNKTVALIAVATATILLAAVIHFAPSARAAEDDKPTSQPAVDTKPTEAEKPTGTASVQTAPVRSGDISQTVVAYGSVTAQPGEIAVFSVPYESRVRHLRVTGGQLVDKGAELIDVEPSPEAKLALEEAQSTLQSTTKDLTQTQQRFDMKLGTNSDLLAGQQAVQLAKLRLDSLRQRGAGDDHRSLQSDAPGLVSKIDVQEGQLVPAGGPLVEIVPAGRIEVRLGVEPSQAHLLKSGQVVKLFPSAGPDEGVAGTIRLVTQRVNPDTRLVDVFVTPAADVPLLLEGGVRGEFTARTETGLIVPHNAVLPDDQGFTLFTVKDGAAVKHTVTPGLANDDEVAVTANDLHAGDTVVVVGNLELDNGMAVTTTGATAGAEGAGK